MKHLGGFAPSEDETGMIEEFVTWMEEHGYHGFLLINKCGVGVSWANEPSAEDFRNTIINSIAHIFDDNEIVATEFARGVVLAAKKLTGGGQNL